MIRTPKLLILALTAIALQVSAFAQQTPGNRFESEIQKLETSDKGNPPPQGAVLFIGSSSIRLWKSLTTDFPGVKVINRGFGGSEIRDSTYFVDRIVTPYHPRLVVFYAGDNDLAGGRTPQQALEDYKAFVDRVRLNLPRVKIDFISIKPSVAREALLDKMKQTNSLIKSYVAKDRDQRFIDVFTPMLNAEGKPRPELFGPDNLHMNANGYELWRAVVAPYLK